MRWISKLNEPPASIRDYLAAQAAVGHGMNYPTFASTGAPGGGSRGAQLRRELTAEQYGLCAYTGAGIDARLGRLTNPAAKLKFSAHNEHLKPQSVCRQEMEGSGKSYGRDVGEDMDHRNIVAALLVSGGGRKVHKKYLFGASHRENDALPIRPTDMSCEQRFAFDLSGGISPATPEDQEAVDTITVLNLGHKTLAGWREQAIAAFVEGIENRADAESIVEELATPKNDRLPEYSFVIRQVIERLLDEMPSPEPEGS